MSDQGELAKRSKAPSDDTSAFESVADDATGPMPAVEPEDEYGPASTWFDSADAGRSEPDTTGTGTTGTQRAASAPFAPVEPEDERPPGKLVFPDPQVPDAELDSSIGGAAPEPAEQQRMPGRNRPSDYMDYSDNEYADTEYRDTEYRETESPDTQYADTQYADTGYKSTGYADTDDKGTGYDGTGYADTGYKSTGYADTEYADTEYAGTEYAGTGYADDHPATDRTASDRAVSEYGPLGYAASEPEPGFGEAAAGTSDTRDEARGSAARVEYSAPPAGGWEGALFDETADSEPGDGRYAPVMPSGPSTPPKPGTPSSGNLRIPDWMREENGGASGGGSDEDDFGDDFRDRRRSKGRAKAKDSARAKGGARAKDSTEEKDSAKSRDRNYDDSGGGSRAPLFAGVGLLVVALIASAGVYFLKGRGGSDPEPPTQTSARERPAGGSQPQGALPAPADKALKRFPGTPSRAVGRMTDARAGLSYPRFGSPWQMPTKQNKLGQLGWSGQQIVVTEQRGTRLWYGQLLSGTLNPAEVSMYGGPGTEKAAAVAFANSIETRFYGFPHQTQPHASQPLTVDGHKGWLISSYLRYQRPGVKATGELLITAVIDTGRKVPAVLFIGIPNTHRKLWADVSYFLSNLHVAR
ncbi:hypothetical protein [Actinomadura alba]|uniref:hypothetical protein n=1 Tax=Actinomadura alba TaxID=406431 RepID=UPI001C9C1B39|nr:hypothetical protein [Actinomadura alba]